MTRLALSGFLCACCLGTATGFLCRSLTTKTRPTIGSPILAAKDSYDVVVIGSGIGGLCCASMLAKYGYSVAVFEQHYSPGGAAHGYQVKTKEGTFSFDTGPSFFSGLNPDIPAKASNPLRTILDALDEEVECVPYTTFGLMLPEGRLTHTADFTQLLAQVGSNVDDWNLLLNRMKPLEAAVAALPTAALRFDVGAVLTVGPFLPNFASLNPLENLKLTKPFSTILEGIRDPFVRNWMDLLCFCLSGLPADGTITAEMALMLGEFYQPTATMDAPQGGASAIVDALVRGLTKNGGELHVGTSVDSVEVEGGRAVGVKLANGQVVLAKQAVVSNLSVWDLYGSDMIPRGVLSPRFVQERVETPPGKSFMHLHVGFRMTRVELQKLEAHYIYLKDWSRGVEAEDNAVLVSIPSVHDESLAPEGYGVLHAYTPATEDYSLWQGIDRHSQEYKQLKEERSQYIWDVLETIIPDIRQRSYISQVGSPLTHQRWLRRHQGSYGPAIRAGEQSFPFPSTPLNGLLVCGDSCFPGIGVPAVAGSGLLAAHSISLGSVKPQLAVLKSLKAL